MVKLRDLFNERKETDETVLSNTPTKMTTDIKKKVFKDKLVMDVVDDSQMVLTTQALCKCPEGKECKCVKRILVDYK